MLPFTKKMSCTRNENQLTSTAESASRRETFAFATLVVFLLIVSLATTITNVVIIYKLRLVPGFQFFDFFSDHVFFHKDTYADKVLLANNKINGLSTITGNVELASGETSMRLNQNGVRISSPRGFEVRSSQSGELLFPFDFAAMPLTSIKTLSVPSGLRDVKMIRSPMDEDLNVVGRDKVRIRGNQGVRIEGKRINVEANSIFIGSINSSIVLDSHQGVYLDMDLFKQKIANRESLSSSQRTATGSAGAHTQYKLCVCAKNGRLFRIAATDATSSCADARFPQSENPCA